jgi:hypothetical protein
MMSNRKTSELDRSWETMKSDLPERTGRRERLIVTIAWLLMSAASLAQQTGVPGSIALEAEKQEEIRRYSVELIIFEFTDRSSAGTEVFDPELPPALPGEEPYFGDVPPEQKVDFDSTPPEDTDPGLVVGADAPFPADDTADLTPAFIDEPLVPILTSEQSGLVILGPEDYVLNDAYERLQRLDAYRPLMRAAWIQPTLEKAQTAPIKLRRLGNPPLRLDGTVTLYLSRFLHLVIDLSLEEKAPLRGPLADDRVRAFGDNRSGRSRSGFDPEFISPATFYRIEEDRIVRNGELRYYDHPRFGVLAKITRVEEEESRENVTDRFATPIAGSN